MGSKKKPKKARNPVIDVAAVRVDSDSDGVPEYVTSRSYAEVVDLISEGPIEGITSGNYSYTRNDNITGYQKVQFTHYTATGVNLDSDDQQAKDLGFLRSVYWNEVPVVDDSGFYNFSSVNLNYVKGNPSGDVPKVNENLPTFGAVPSSRIMDLSINRTIGERLYGPEIKGGDDSPTNTKHAISKSPIDKYAKTYSILNKECNEIIVRIKVPSLQENLQFGEKTYKKRQAATGYGDQKARIIEYSIFYQPMFNDRFSSNKTTSDTLSQFSTESWELAKNEIIEGKIEEGYIRSTTIDLSDKGFQDKDNFEGWRIRIVRTTPESITSFLRNQSFVDSIVEVYGTKLRYPYSSMVYSLFDARSFQRIPSRAYDARLLKVKVPNNYNPFIKSYGNSSASASSYYKGVALGDKTNTKTDLNRTADGFTFQRNNEDPTVEWDGNFAEDLIWTDNPAWCFYDLITNPRYGLGEFIDASQIDKWALYDVAKYCDELVDDTYGGFEPRFTINYIITSREEAFKVLNDLSSIFRGIAYYSNGSIFSSQDKLKSAIYSFNNSNVLDGNFTYSSSAKKARHTVAIVRYNDKRNSYQPAVEYMEDEEYVKRYGIRELETTALGCTSRGQARRFAKWILASESEETETASFSVGMDGAYLRPGDVISIYDNYRNPLKYSGRTNAVIKGGTDITYANRLTETALTTTQRENVNSIIIDQALNFKKDKKYKFSLLTPTYDYNEQTVSSSVDVDEGVRRTQIQNLVFNGSDVINITGAPGAFRSDLRNVGSAVCTKIYFNSGIRIEDLDGVSKGSVVGEPYTGNQLNFADYVITGYSNNNVARSSEAVPYSGNYHSGQNLIWSVEPLFDNDPEFINNNESAYRIINIAEDEDSTYSISALAYSTGKYESVDSVGSSYTKNNVLDLFFPVKNNAAKSSNRDEWINSYPDQDPVPADSAGKRNSDILDVILDTPSIPGTYPDKGQNLVTLKSEFSVAGFKNNLNIANDGKSVDINYGESNNINNISYSFIIIPTTDPKITTEWIDSTKGSPITAVEGVTYIVDKGSYDAVKQNEVKLITPEDTKFFNNIEGQQKSKIQIENLISENDDYYVIVYPISNVGVIGHGLFRKIAVDTDKFTAPVQTFSISNLTTRGSDGFPIQSTASDVRGYSLDNTNPTFEWQVSSQKGIFNMSEEEQAGNIGNDGNLGFGRYELNFDTVQNIDYRVTIRRPSNVVDLGVTSTSANVPDSHIYFEFTGYTSPSTKPTFLFGEEINNPDLIDDLKSASYTSTNLNARGFSKYEGTSQSSTFYKATPSGMVIRESEELPLRQFDIVIETQDEQGETSAGNQVYDNTVPILNTDGTIKSPPSKESWNPDGFNSTYDILGVKIDSPSGIFFSQSSSEEGKDNEYFTMNEVAEHNYPYKASMKLLTEGTIDVTLEAVEALDGQRTLTDQELDRFFNDVEGVVYYYTTGDNSRNDNDQYSNLAPNFKLSINTQDKHGAYNIKSNENINNNRSSSVDAVDGKGFAFDKVVLLDAGYANHQKFMPDGTTPKPNYVGPRVHRGYHVFSANEGIDGFKIPFSMINNPKVTNINIAIALFDSLSLRRAFITDENDSPKYDVSTTNQESPRIFSDHTLNFSTLPNRNVEYNFSNPFSTRDGIAFLEPLGTSFRLREFSAVSAAFKSMTFACWAELVVCHNETEATKIVDRKNRVSGDQPNERGKSVFFPNSSADYRASVNYRELEINTQDTDDKNLCKSIVKGDLVGVNNIQVWTSHISHDTNFFIEITFNRSLDKNKYTVFVDTGYPGIPSNSVYGTATINPYHIVKHNDKVFLRFEQQPIYNLYSTWQPIVAAGGIKFKFGILVDLE
jgi:hypothetical protein